MIHPQNDDKISNGRPTIRDASLPASHLEDAPSSPKSSHSHSGDRLQDYLKGKREQVVQSLREEIPGLQDIEIDTDITHSATTPWHPIFAKAAPSVGSCS